MAATFATSLLVLSGGADWEAEALSGLGATPGLVVIKRCIDIADLLATAASGQASVAVVAAGAPGFDRPAVDHLLRHGMSLVVVVPRGWRDDEVEQLRRSGVRHVLADGEVARIGEVVRNLQDRPAQGADQALATPAQSGPATTRGQGRAIAVWGPGGAPGRTTVALGLASALAFRGADPLLLDLDPWGGTVAQHLGILDDVSGLLACNRNFASGTLVPTYTSLQRRVAGVRVVTGLPRAERWSEVRTGAVEEMIRLGCRQGPVVLDTGFALEEDSAADWTGRPGRNDLTRTALNAADEVVVVGAADPVGLTRLARGLTELQESAELGGVHVVVNRMRRTLGWSEHDVAAMLSGYGHLRGVHFLPYEQAAVDRALVTGRTVFELGDGPLVRALAEVAATVLPPDAPAPEGRFGSRSVRAIRRRTTGTGRRR